MAKNELQRLRNIARARNVRVPGASGVTPITDKRVRAQTGGAEEAGRAAELARASTASLGKFQPGLKPALEKQVSSGGRNFATIHTLAFYGCMGSR